MDNSRPDFTAVLQEPEYNFIKTNEHLGSNVILLGLGGSYSYGTNVGTSDIDFRGIAMNSKSDLIGLTQFDQYVDEHTDTVIYGFKKILQLFISCNPNAIEILGLRPEDYMILSPAGQLLLDNRRLFLSKRALHSFGGYADAQLRRMQNAIARDTLPQSEREKHIFNSVRHTIDSFNSLHQWFENGSMELFIDEAVNPEMETEIFVNAQLLHYPLRDYAGMWNIMSNVVRDYDKIGKRNRKKDDMHLNKHAMHLVRLFLMALDILERGEINTYRDKEHDLLMDIRFGKYQKEDGTYDSSFYDLLAELESRMQYAAKHTDLPDEPDMEKVQELAIELNERAINDRLWD